MKAAQLLLALVLVACASGTSSSTTDTSSLPTSSAPPTTTTTTTTSTTTTTIATTTTLSADAIAAEVHASDVKQIRDLWRGFSDAWFVGVDAGLAYIVEHNYPAEGCTLDDLAFDAPEGYREEHIVDPDSIERNDGWVIPGGTAGGIVPEGRVYILTVESVFTATDFAPETEVAELHTVIEDDGDVYFFYPCS